MEGRGNFAVCGVQWGGTAAGEALEEAKPREIDRLALLAAGAYGHPEK